MHTTEPVANPFALLLNPAAVFAEIERSERLTRLASRICRPLDKPVLGVPEVAAEERDFRDDSSTASI